MSWTNDPVADSYSHDAQQAAALKKLPKCDECGEPIQYDKFHLIFGCKICPDCLEKFEKWTEEYIEL